MKLRCAPTVACPVHRASDAVRRGGDIVPAASASVLCSWRHQRVAGYTADADVDEVPKCYLFESTCVLNSVYREYVLRVPFSLLIDRLFLSFCVHFVLWLTFGAGLVAWLDTWLDSGHGTWPVNSGLQSGNSSGTAMWTEDGGDDPAAAARDGDGAPAQAESKASSSWVS